jgi:hypothetical protein
MSELTGTALDEALGDALGLRLRTPAVVDTIIGQRTFPWKHDGTLRDEPPAFSSNISEAFALVEAMRGKGYRPLVNVGSVLSQHEVKP